MICTRRIAVITVLLTAVALTAAGCGEVLTADTADAGPGDTIDGSAVAIDALIPADATPADPCTGNVAAEDMPDCYLGAICELSTRCLALYPSVEECVTAGGPYGRGGDPHVGLKRLFDAANAGTVIYNADKAGACMAGLSSVTCVEFLTSESDTFDPACDEIFSGNVAGGGACFEREECQTPGARCEQTGSCNLQCCVGTCSIPIPVGGDCTTGSCVSGAHCVRDSTNTIRTCESGDLNAPCTGSWNCDDELWCDAVSGSLGMCKNDFPSGATCTDDEQCPGVEECVGDDLVPAVQGMCKTVSATGDACDELCNEPLWCNQPDSSVAGTCEPVPALGASCADSFGQCAGLLWCDPLDSTCKAPKTQGAACEGSIECAQPLFCDADITGTSPGTCRVPQPSGVLCKRDRHCQSSLCVKDPGGGTLRFCEDYVSCY